MEEVAGGPILSGTHRRRLLEGEAGMPTASAHTAIPAARAWRSGLLVALLIVMALALGWVTWSEVRTGREQIEQMAAAYARSVATIIAESGEHGLQAFRGWEDALSRRLLDNALWIARLDSIAPLTPEQLQELARPHALYRVHLYDREGRRVASTSPGWRPGMHMGAGPWGGFGRERLAPLLEGRRRAQHFGEHRSRMRSGTRLAAGAARVRGGAVVVAVDADSLRGTLAQVEPAHLIEILSHAPGVRYVALQDGEDLLALSPEGAGPLPPLPQESPAAGAMSGDVGVRRVALAQGGVIEATVPMEMPGVIGSLLRVGLDDEVFDTMWQGLRRRAWVRLLVFVVAGALAGLLALAWQRHRVLDREIAGVRAELQAREQEALQTQKVAAMGALAAGVAHQIRNPLNTITMIAQQLERSEAIDSGARRSLGLVRSEGRRIEEIIQQFLRFARPQPPVWEQLELDAVVADVVAASRAAFEAAQVELAFEPTRVTGRADRGYVIQIAENLLRNAREAAPAGSIVRVELAARGDEVELVVSDRGAGVPPEERERIFDLCYTTRPDGSGIGLSEVARMAAAMGGGVRVEEVAGGGARFRVRWSRSPGGETR